MKRVAILSSLLGGCVVQPDRILAPTMIRLPLGSFIAGSDPAETDAAQYPTAYAAREQPARRVSVARPFAIGRTEVTRGDFARFVAATNWMPDGPCSFLADGRSHRWAADRAHDWRHPGFEQTDAHPVVCVSFADAQAYTAWLSSTTGRRFRLPSNTEWEYAARAGTTTAVYWGDRPPDKACDYANLLDASAARRHGGGVADPMTSFPCDDGYANTAPVASFRPNAWGLYDMIGNVWELTRDCLDANQVGAPRDTSARTAGDCGSRIDRGASWTNTRRYVRAAAQHPDLVTARTTVLGFRLVEDLP
jgi:formylglycine-generating enzyme required for sulfatase activity